MDGRTIFLAGTGRSGTTWAANIVNYDQRYRLIFEPFHPHKVDAVRNFRYRQYLRPDDDRKEFVKPARRILRGNLSNRWTDKHSGKIRGKHSRILIKDIRANHLLRWIMARFPEVLIILLLRHPCAVAYSKLCLGWDTHLGEFLDQPDLMDDFLGPFRREIGNAGNDFEKHVFMWCVENYVPLRQFASGEIHLAFYENFCTRPKREIGRLFSFLDEPYGPEAHKRVAEPSALVRKGSAINTGENLVENWKKHITKVQVVRAMEILTLFGLQEIYSEDPLPLISGEWNPLQTGKADSL